MSRDVLVKSQASLRDHFWTKVQRAISTESLPKVGGWRHIARVETSGDERGAPSHLQAFNTAAQREFCIEEIYAFFSLRFGLQGRPA
jgi:hypothetical protein